MPVLARLPHAALGPAVGDRVRPLAASQRVLATFTIVLNGPWLWGLLWGCSLDILIVRRIMLGKAEQTTQKFGRA